MNIATKREKIGIDCVFKKNKSMHNRYYFISTNNMLVVS